MALGCRGWCQHEDIGRILTCHSCGGSWCEWGGNLSSLPAANTISRHMYLIKRQIILPPFPGITYLYIGGGGEMCEVRICFAFITYLHYVLLSSAEHNPRTSCGKYNQSNSCYFGVFHTVVFLLLLVFFFSLSPPFFLRLEQVQCDRQKIGRLQQSRGSDFSSK